MAVDTPWEVLRADRQARANLLLSLLGLDGTATLACLRIAEFHNARELRCSDGRYRQSVAALEDLHASERAVCAQHL